MLEHLLVITTAILNATSKRLLDTKTLGRRLDILNDRRMGVIEKNDDLKEVKCGDQTRAELIHYFGRLVEAKVRSRI